MREALASEKQRVARAHPVPLREPLGIGASAMTDQAPSQWEQDVAEAYVNGRSLHRPNLRLHHAVLGVAVYLAVTILLTFLIVAPLGRAALPPSLFLAPEFLATHPILAAAIVYVLVCTLTLGICGKWIVIGVVRLYQHYAPDEIRRRCLFKPTCSEYAILALLKHGLVLGGLRTFARLHRRCRGTIYSIDYP